MLRGLGYLASPGPLFDYSQGWYTDVAALEIDGTREQQFAIIRAKVIEFDADLNGNGQPGIKDFVSSTRGQLRLIVILISVVGVLVAVMTYLEANRQMRSGLLGSGTFDRAAETAHGWNYRYWCPE